MILHFRLDSKGCFVDAELVKNLETVALELVCEVLLAGDIVDVLLVQFHPEARCGIRDLGPLDVNSADRQGRHKVHL